MLISAVDNESDTASTTTSRSKSGSSECEIVMTGSSARGRRLLKIREEKRKRQYDRLHNYPAWAKSTLLFFSLSFLFIYLFLSK